MSSARATNSIDATYTSSFSWSNTCMATFYPTSGTGSGTGSGTNENERIPNLDPDYAGRDVDRYPWLDKART
jgi:hypothetical protein